MLALLPFPDIDPVLISFEIMGRQFSVHWYAIAYIAGFICAWFWIKYLINRTALWAPKEAPMKVVQLEDLATWMIIGTILGGRLGYVLFYQFGDFMGDPMRILRVWEGGMSFHGGFLGVIIGGYLYCRKNKLDAWSVGDLIASSACFGLLFGRLANFVNAELWGRPTDVPWAVAFPGEAAQNCVGVLTPVCGRHPSQLYEAGLEGPILFAIMALLIVKRDWLRTPGQIIGVFFIGYGIARTIVEGFRQADAQFITDSNPMGHVIGSADFGLTMGQPLSLPMIAIGIAIIFVARKRA